MFRTPLANKTWLIPKVAVRPILQETEAERENAQAQYAAGMAQLDDQPGSQNSQEIIDELKSLDEQLKKKHKLIQQIQVCLSISQLLESALIRLVLPAQKIVIEEEGNKLKVQSRIDKNKKAYNSLATSIASHEAELEGVKKERDVSPLRSLKFDGPLVCSRYRSAVPHRASDEDLR